MFKKTIRRSRSNQFSKGSGASFRVGTLDKDFSTSWRLRFNESALASLGFRALTAFSKALSPWRFRLPKRHKLCAQGVASLFGLVLLLAVTNGCLTLYHPLPAVNLREPGWSVHQGQAVWKLPGGKHDIAGDVMVATDPQGRSFVQFSKSPFPLVIAQTTSSRWQVEFPAQNKRYSGPGSPPKRLIWLYLPLVLSGKAPPHGWIWTNSGSNWRLHNPATGEEVEGFFAQ